MFYNTNQIRAIVAVIKYSKANLCSSKNEYMYTSTNKGGGIFIMDTADLQW